MFDIMIPLGSHTLSSLLGDFNRFICLFVEHSGSGRGRLSGSQDILYVMYGKLSLFSDEIERANDEQKIGLGNDAR